MPTCWKKSERGDDKSGGVLDAPEGSYAVSETPAQSSRLASDTMFESSVGDGSMVAGRGERGEICADAQKYPTLDFPKQVADGLLRDGGYKKKVVQVRQA